MLDENAVILLAEDLEDDIGILRQAFLQAGLHHVQVVRNGDEVIAYLEGCGKYANRSTYPCPAILLLDLKMPGRSGFDVIQWVRSHEDLKRLPIVVLTDSPAVIDVNRAYDSGANSYLLKPTNFQEIVRLAKAFAEYWLMFSKHPTYRENPQFL